MKISVLMTVFNGERFLKETIESVLKQTLKDFEFIIIDDGSTDKTKEIIESFKDERIKYFYYGENKGYYNLDNVINFGLEKCKGDYIARIDADDICYPERLQKQYDYLEKNKDIFLVGTSADIIDKDGTIIDKIIKREYPSIVLKYRMAISNPFIHSSIMFRNEHHKYISYNEHAFYFYMTFLGKKMKNIKEILVQYRINPVGVMSKEADLNNNKYKELYKE